MVERVPLFYLFWQTWNQFHLLVRTGRELMQLVAPLSNDWFMGLYGLVGLGDFHLGNGVNGYFSYFR